FMAPPDFAFRLMREATLRVALDDPSVRPLINPRQSAPIAYTDSPLNGPDEGAWTSDLAAPGQPAPEALLRGARGDFHLTQCLGTAFTCIVFGDGSVPHAVANLAEHGVAVLDVMPEADAH